MYNVDGVHIRRPLPSIILLHVPSELIICFEYLITCLPCTSLFVSNPSPLTKVPSIIQELSSQSLSSIVDLKCIEDADLTIEEVIQIIVFSLQSRVCM